MRNMIEILDNFVQDAKIVFTVHGDEYQPLLFAGDTVELVTDGSEYGVKLVCIRDSFCLARIQYQNKLIRVTDLLHGTTQVYDEDQSVDLPVSVLGTVKQITFQ